MDKKKNITSANERNVMFAAEREREKRKMY